MRMVIVEVWDVRREKRIKRYTEWFLEPSTLTREEKKAFALAECVRKYGKLFPNGTWRLYVGNQ